MQTRRRSFTVFLAIAAVALANCVGPQMVLAAHHPAMNKVVQKIAEPSHDHASHRAHMNGNDRHAHGDAGHDFADTDGGDVSNDLAKACCSTLTCMASGVMVSALAVGVSPIAAAIAATPLDDMLRAFNAAAIDPPPRMG